ncbi:MAG: transglutaminase-like domain-containing protein [Planctomycetia bacterium]|nr:transglutaminase-like domain-containing protein [Planctomycetia bacterium]
MRRREFLQSAAAGLYCGGSLSATDPSTAEKQTENHLVNEWSPEPPTFSVIPVVGDGRWIWNKPPENETGYLEPRRFRLQVGIELTGRGDAEGITATTPVPIGVPEQEIVSESIKVVGSEATLESIAPLARQLKMFAPQLSRGQTASAVAEFELRLQKQYFGYSREKFPAAQTVPPEVRSAFLGDSPGIQTRSPNVLALVKELTEEGASGTKASAAEHPWRQAELFAAWVRENIKPKLGAYTSVTKAIENRFGDCEEMAGVFVALCRAVGIPARLVWIPNHVWSEFYLADDAGTGHWIPVHTACYHWFGWTGVHELVLQKGDRLRVPGKGTLVRLQQDRLQWIGTKPDAKYWAELTPLADADAKATSADANTDTSDAGPGARRKGPTGEWLPIGKHPLDKSLRR